MDAKFMTYCQAVQALEKGHCVRRAFWHDSVWLQLVTADCWQMTSDAISNDAPVTLMPWIGIKTSFDAFGPWLPSNSDHFATDWLLMKVA